MKSVLAGELKLKYQPVAIILSNEKPDEALQFVEGRWGCVIAMLSAAAKGRTAVMDRKAVACQGGAIGLGLCKEYKIPGGIEYFLSCGRGEGYPEGECYFKSPEIAKQFADSLPVEDIPYEYVIFKPLPLVDLEKETPTLVCMYANPDQLSALVVLANYFRTPPDNVMIPMGAGCHSIFIYPYAESKKEQPRAVVGMVDITARPMVDSNVLSFTVPWSMFLEMEENVPGSFFEKHDWKKVRDRIPEP